MANPNASASTVTAFTTAVVLLGVNFVAVRASNQELDPFWGAAVRFAMASFILITLAWSLNIPMPKGRALAYAVVYGMVAFAIEYALLYWALISINASTASVIFAAVPLITLAIAVPIGLERFKWNGLAGALIAFAGIAAIFAKGIGGTRHVAAFIAIIGAAAAAAISGIIVKKMPRTHPISTNAIGMAVSFPALAAASWMTREAWSLPTQTSTWAALAWLVNSSVIGFILVVYVIQRWTASAASYIAVLLPLVTMVAAAWLAREAITIEFLAAAALVLWGVYVANVWKPPARRSALLPAQDATANT